MVGDAGAYDPVSDLVVGAFKPPFEKTGASPRLFTARVHGQAAGIAAALALSCDLPAMAHDASPYLTLAATGLVPDGGLSHCPLQPLGPRHALAAIVEGVRLDPAKCLETRLVNHVFAADEISILTEQWAVTLTSTAPLATRAAKRVVRTTGNAG